MNSSTAIFLHTFGEENGYDLKNDLCLQVFARQSKATRLVYS
jgi:hypothetical protein